VKKLFLILGALGVLAVGGYVLFLTFFDPEAQRAALEQRLEQSFGRPVTVGPLEMGFRNGIGIRVDGIRVEQDSSFGAGSVVEVGSVWANVGLWDYLLRREPTIDKLTLDNARVTLVKREDGVWNWAVLGAGQPAAASREAGGGPVLAAALATWGIAVDPTQVVIEQVEAAGIQVTMINREAEPDTEVVYKGVGLTASLSPEGNAYRVRARVQADSAAAGGEPLVADLPYDGLVTPPGQRPIWQAQGRVEGGRLATRNFKIDTVTSGVALDEAQTLHLAPLHMELYGGVFDGNFDLALATAGNHFTTSGHLENVGLEGLLAARPDLANTLMGRVSADFQGAGDLGDFNYTLQSLTGGGRFTMAEAGLTSVNVLRQVAEKGGFQQIEFEETGTRVERVESEFNMNAGRFEVRNATLANINGYADARASTGWVDLREPASMQFVGEVTLLPPLFEKVKGASPMAHVVLNAVAAGRPVTVPLMVHGPVEQPAVSVRWAVVLRPFLPPAAAFFLPGLSD
jgi:hypothetical protein